MANVSLADLLDLTVPERIQLLQDLWDSLVAEPDAIGVLDAQRQEIERRSAAHRHHPDEAVSLDEAIARIEQTLRCDIG